jgi:Ni,Fe-hydrogenase III large subunit/Ni,Fe-hydrogenase III component G
MSRFDWLSEYLACLQDEHVLVRHGSATRLAPAHVLEIDAEDWGQAGRQAAAFGCRWAGVWADQRDDEFSVLCLLEYQGDYLILCTEIPVATPLLPSHTPYYPGADRPERHLQDMFGIAFGDHPDARRWIRHQAWSEDQYPLRDGFPVKGSDPQETPPDDDYPFLRAQGAGVYEIPVGPVHAGIIEPGHFRFQAVGEAVLKLEERLGYVHKGIEKIAVGRNPLALARLAGRVSGDTTVAHAWAACQAMERAAGIKLPVRAQALRSLLAERERVANHLGDIGAICNDVGFAFALYQFSRLREIWQRRSHELFGHRFMMDVVIPGGVTADIDQEALALLREDHHVLRGELRTLYDILEDHPSLEDRLMTTGRLTPETARQLGCLGYVGKASGQGFDVRRDNPYPPYDHLAVTVPVFEEGDVAARLRVRMEEILIALDFLDRLLEGLPGGEIRWEMPAPEAGAEGIGFVEGWRGEIVTYVRFGEAGRVARFFPRDPSWFNWPALERIVLGNIVPDFPVCNKSVNGSYSGHDL